MSKVTTGIPRPHSIKTLIPFLKEHPKLRKHHEVKELSLDVEFLRFEGGVLHLKRSDGGNALVYLAGGCDSLSETGLEFDEKGFYVEKWNMRTFYQYVGG